MIEGYEEHTAFIEYCENNGLSTERDPLFLVFLHPETAEVLVHFKAGYEYGKRKVCQ